MSDPTPGPADPKPATEHTRAVLSAAVVDFDDARDEANVDRGFVAAHPTGRIEHGGGVVWDVAAHDFVRDGADAPDTVHPGLWRQAKLNARHGLFEVAEGVWQARGYDISNITFIAGERGWIIIDPLTTEATASACLALADDVLGARPVTAVIYTHSHVDHFGGIYGVTSDEAVERGEVRVIAPAGFLHEVVGENGLAGPIMTRRALYQFGPLLPPGPRGQVDVGLGQALPLGQPGLIAPTETIAATGDELTVDGVRIIFQDTPDAEAPAEMNFFFPDKRLLCMAENCTHTLHNLYPLRGAKIRDSLAWSKYVQEALLMWGDHTDVSFASHHWPRFGTDDVRAFLTLQRDVYRWMHDQTLRLANHGYSPDEISEELRLPEPFARQSHVQGYYGTVSHNVRSVHHRYLGWYDGNPASLHPLPEVETGRRYVALMGGAAAVLDAARHAFAEGDYRWVVQLVDNVIQSDPSNREARLLSADAMEQLGYQAESGTWRNAYLSGASELRHGSLQMGQWRPRDMDSAMAAEQLVDSIGVRFDPTRFRARARLVLHLTDLDEHHLLGIENHAVHHEPLAADAPEVSGAGVDAVVAVDRRTLVGALHDLTEWESALADGRATVPHGEASVVGELIGALDTFGMPPLVEPRT